MENIPEAGRQDQNDDSYSTKEDRDTQHEFENDLLNRKESIEVLTSIIGSIEGSCVLAVDAPWGTGKSTFLRMWTQYLRNRAFPVVEFNAWETDFSGDPFIALSSEITASLDNLPESSTSLHIEDLKAAVNSVIHTWSGPSLRILASMVPQVGPQIAKELEGTSTSPPETGTSDYLATKRAIQEFTTVLHDTAMSLAKLHEEKPLVVVIDELDRCRPSYAVVLLEIAKHLFTVDRIIFVLALDRRQLTHSIKVIYGSAFDAEGYLRRFFDVDYRLPDPNREGFITAMLSSVGITEYYRNIPGFAKRESELALQVLYGWFAKSHFSLRDIGQAIHRLGLVLASLSNHEQTFAQTVVVLLVMRTANPDLYNRFVRGELTDEDAVEGMYGTPECGILRNTREGNLVEAVIIAAKREAIQAEWYSGTRLGYDKAAELDQPMYRRYKELSAADPRGDAGRILAMANGAPGVGFHTSVQRLELLSRELKDQAP